MEDITKKNGKVLSVLQEKGGCGKSCAIFNIASYLSRNYKVLIIDLDGQAADITYYLFGNKIRNSQENILTIIDMFRRNIDVNEITIPLEDNLHVIPADIQVTNIASTDKISVFKRAIRQLKEKYDYILIDVPPSPNWAHALCFSVCDYIIPIVNPDAASPKALISLSDSIEEIKETTNPNAEYLGIIMNMYDGRTKLAKEMFGQIEHIADLLETCMFRTMIHRSVVLSEHILFHKSIFDYAPKSKAAEEYTALTKEILERIKDLEGENL